MQGLPQLTVSIHKYRMVGSGNPSISVDDRIPLGTQQFSQLRQLFATSASLPASTITNHYVSRDLSESLHGKPCSRHSQRVVVASALLDLTILHTRGCRRVLEGRLCSKPNNDRYSLILTQMISYHVSILLASVIFAHRSTTSKTRPSLSRQQKKCQIQWTFDTPGRESARVEVPTHTE